MITAKQLRLEAIKAICPAQYEKELAHHKKYEPINEKIELIGTLLLHKNSDYIDILKVYDQHDMGKISYKKLIKYLDSKIQEIVYGHR